MAKPNKIRRQEYRYRKANGLCPRCGSKRSKKSKFIFCGKCRRYFREYLEITAPDRAAEKKERYDLRKKQHKCTRCGKQLSKTYKNSKCRPCLDRQYKLEKKRKYLPLKRQILPR